MHASFNGLLKTDYHRLLYVHNNVCHNIKKHTWLRLFNNSCSTTFSKHNYYKPNIGIENDKKKYITHTQLVK